MGLPAAELSLRMSKLPPKPRSVDDVRWVAARWVAHLDALPHVAGLEPIETLHQLRMMLAHQAARLCWQGRQLASSGKNPMKTMLAEVRATLLVKELTLCLAALEHLDD